MLGKFERWKVAEEREDKQIPRCARNDRERQGQREGTMYRAPTANYKHH